MIEIKLPSVDVVVPCYNYGRYLETCVSSVLSQEGVEVRVLIIDDVSQDDSVEVAERIAAADPRVAVLKHTANKGLVGTANDGVIDWARAKYTLLLSADDALTAGSLRRSTSVMEAHPEVAIAYGMALVVAESAEMVPTENPYTFDYVVMTGGEFIERACTNWCGVASPTALIRTNMQHEVGGLDPRFPQTCDMEIWLRLATRAGVAALNTTQAYYRRHDSNMSTVAMDRALSDLREQFDTVVAVLATWGENLVERSRWLNLVKRRIAMQACWKAGVAFERGDAEDARACLAFAKEVDPSIPRSAPWLRAQAKHLLGASVVHALKRGKQSGAISFNPFVRGQLFGWWPSRRASSRMSL
jgi:GT2 family glycosyltransferase